MFFLTDLQLENKRVLIREDLNVPIKNGKVTSNTRIQAALPTIKLAHEKGARVIILSHLGRPIEGEFNQEFSLKPVADELSSLLNLPVRYVKDYLNGLEIEQGEIVLCENVRFNKGEKSNDDNLAKQYANLCDIFVMDAFATTHRKQASTYAVAKYAPKVCAGPLLTAELDALRKSFSKAKPPSVGVFGGSKVSTKLLVLKSLYKRLNTLIVGGGIANTFMLAAGLPIGKSLVEEDLVVEAKNIMNDAKNCNCLIPLPIDVIVGTSLSEDSSAICKDVSDICSDDMILDIGPKTIELYNNLIMSANSILWNGPVGAFEIDQFSKGTQEICKSICKSSAFSVAGGGDTLAAVSKFGCKGISYLSTGGGAFLEFLEKGNLPAVEILEERS